MSAEMTICDFNAPIATISDYERWLVKFCSLIGMTNKLKRSETQGAELGGAWVR